jgi:hypothetical protein
VAVPEPELDEETKAAIAAKMAEAEALGEQGEVDDAQRKLEEVEAIKRLASVRAAPSRAVLERERDQKLRVCDICGAFLSIYDRCRPAAIPHLDSHPTSRGCPHSLVQSARTSVLPAAHLSPLTEPPPARLAVHASALACLGLHLAGAVESC